MPKKIDLFYLFIYFFSLTLIRYNPIDIIGNGTDAQMTKKTGAKIRM